MTGKTDRLHSLDALRGFDMFLITGGSVLLMAFASLVAGHDGTWVHEQMTHVEWEGLRIFDCIFPLFLFITGVTFPFSADRRMARGDGKRAIARNIVRRALVLVACGCVCERMQWLDWPHFRVWSVIGRIGVVWGAAAMLSLFCRFRTCVAIVVLDLVGWWLFLRLVPSPEASGADPIATQIGCVANWIDTHYLTTAHRHEGGLATLAMLPTAMFGIWAGRWLKTAWERRSQSPYVLHMVLAGVAAVMAGWLWSLPSWGMPVVKNIWTGSYALINGGISIILLALFHWIIDVKGWIAWSFYFRVIGMNAIVIYMTHFFVPYGQIGDYFLKRVSQSVAVQGWPEFVTALGTCITAWLVVYFLYRKNIFVKA